MRLLFKYSAEPPWTLVLHPSPTAIKKINHINTSQVCSPIWSRVSKTDIFWQLEFPEPPIISKRVSKLSDMDFRSLLTNSNNKKSVFTFQNQNLLIIFQLLSKTCNVILSVPRSWRQVCAIRTLCKRWNTLHKLQIAQTCLHDLGADKMTAEKLRIDEYFEQMTLQVIW